MPWGTAEARELGIYDTIMAAGGRELRWWDSYQGSRRTGHRDLVTTTSPMAAVIACYHPRMQESLIAEAAEAGAEVRRGARVSGVRTNGAPAVVANVDGRETEMQARLVVGADGRDSMMRRWAGFDVRRDPGHTLVAGLLLDHIPVSDDTSHAWLNSDLGLWVLIFPQGQGLSLTLRDARALRDNLLSHEDWDEAGHACAAEHDQYYGVVHDVELWETRVLLDTGPEADARRRKALGAWGEDRTRQLDILLSGPGPTLDEKARRRFFGEE